MDKSLEFSTLKEAARERMKRSLRGETSTIHSENNKWILTSTDGKKTKRIRRKKRPEVLGTSWNH